MRRCELEWISPGDNSQSVASMRDVPEEARPQPAVRLTEREKVVFLLHIAAEVEHSLFVQYLYAAYSLGGVNNRSELNSDQKEQLQSWQTTIAKIAVEEMAHLLTVQNCLLALGAPTNFDREDYPFRSDFYPFPLQLRPLKKKTIARFVAAEMPAINDVPQSERRLVRRIIRRATATTGNMPINRVGPLYDEIIESIDSLGQSDFVAGYATEFQGHATEWGATPDQTDGRIIWTIDSKEKAKDALAAVRDQGEAPSSGTDDSSHFRRFLKIYKELKAYNGPRAALPVAVDPHTSRRSSWSRRKKRAQITHPCTLLWAQLSDVRYRMALFTFQHYLQLPRPATLNTLDCRNKVLQWLNDNMKLWIRDLSLLLASKPRKESGAGNNATAGNPFQLPYSSSVPFGPVQPWMTHRDMARTALSLVASLRECVTDEDELFLLDEIEFLDKSIESIAISQITNPGEKCND